MKLKNRIAIFAFLFLVSSNITNGQTPYVDWTNNVWIPSEIVLGETAIIAVKGKNNGSASSPEGGISISSPDLTNAGNISLISDNATSTDIPGYKEHAVGSTIWHKNKTQISSTDTLIEFTDKNWQASEENTLNFEFTPTEVGTYRFWVRCWMADSQWDYTNYPAYGTNDQQGWACKQFSVTVTEAPAPDLDPSFSLGSTLQWGGSASPSRVRVYNEGDLDASGVSIVLLASKDGTAGDGDLIIKEWYDVDINAGEQWEEEDVTWNLPSTPYDGFPESGTIYYILRAFPITGETDTDDNSDSENVTVSPAPGTVTATLNNLEGSSYTPQSIRWNIGGETGTGSPEDISNIDIGSQNVSAWQNGGTPWGEEQWYYGSTTVVSGSQTKSFTRNLPYSTGATTLCDSQGAELGLGDSIDLIEGQEYTFKSTVKNPSSAKTVRLRVFLDRSQTSSWDHSLTSTNASVSADGTKDFEVNFTPQSTGTYYFSYAFECSMGGNWVMTDSSGWADAFKVAAAITDAAQIVSVASPGGDVTVGTPFDVKVTVKNTGSSARSFWLGLSFAQKNDQDAYPSESYGFLDVMPQETSVIQPNSSEEITFSVVTTLDMNPGSWYYLTSTWHHYDSLNNEMVPFEEDGGPFDSRDGFAFRNGAASLTDPYGLKQYDDIGLYDLIDPNGDLNLKTNRDTLTKVSSPGFKIQGCIGINSYPEDTNSPEYHGKLSLGDEIDSGDKNLVVTFHGWNSANQEGTLMYQWGFVDFIKYWNAEIPYPEDWKLIAYDWSEDAYFPIAEAEGIIDADRIRHASSNAAASGYLNGLMFTKKLLAQADSNVERIVLVGHSAGCWAVLASAQALSQALPDTEIQIYYLDPYIPAKALFITGVDWEANFNEAKLKSVTNYAKVNSIDYEAIGIYAHDNDQTDQYGIVNYNTTSIGWAWSEGESGLVVDLDEDLTLDSSLANQYSAATDVHILPPAFLGKTCIDPMRSDAELEDGLFVGWQQSLPMEVKGVELELYRICDNTSPTPKTKFEPGDTVQIKFSATNTGESVPVEVVLNLRDQDGNVVYNSDTEGENRSDDSPLNKNEVDYYVFEWEIPSDASSGYYDVIASVRHLDDFDIVLDTLAPGVNTGFDQGGEILHDQFSFYLPVPSAPVLMNDGYIYSGDEVLFDILNYEIGGNLLDMRFDYNEDGVADSEWIAVDESIAFSSAGTYSVRVQVRNGGQINQLSLWSDSTEVVVSPPPDNIIKSLNWNASDDDRVYCYMDVEISAAATYRIRIEFEGGLNYEDNIAYDVGSHRTTFAFTELPQGPFVEKVDVTLEQYVGIASPYIYHDSVSSYVIRDVEAVDQNSLTELNLNVTPQILLEKYAPVLKMHTEDGWTSLPPKDILGILGLANIRRRGDSTFVEQYTTSALEDNNSSKHYIDFLDPLNNEDIWNNDVVAVDNTIYGRIIRVGDINGSRALVLQYWLPYYVNFLNEVDREVFEEWKPYPEFGNYHEGEVENVAVLLIEDQVGDFAPASMYFSKHYDGSVLDWSNVRKYGGPSSPTSQPVVYVALGAHASFASPDEAEEAYGAGFDSDLHSGNGLWYGLESYSVKVTPEVNHNVSDDWNWLMFTGRFGDGSIWPNESPFIFPYAKYNGGSGIYRWVDPLGEMQFYEGDDTGLNYDFSASEIGISYSNVTRLSDNLQSDIQIDVDISVPANVGGDRLHVYYYTAAGEWLLCANLEALSVSMKTISIPEDEVAAGEVRLLVCDALSTSAHTAGTFEYFLSAEVVVSTLHLYGPEEPSPVLPVDDAALGTLTPEFRWSAFSSPITGSSQHGYQVRVRSDSDAGAIVYDEYIVDSNGAAHELPSEILDYGKSYHWHVRYRDNEGNWSEWSADSPGNYQNFTTEEPITYTLSLSGMNGSFEVSPNKAAYTPNEQVTITASADVGYEFSSWSGDVSGNANPLQLTMDTNKSIAAIFASLSTSSFSIISPNGGQSWIQGESRYITWTSTGNPGSNVKLELYKSGSLDHTIAASIANDGEYLWPVSADQTVGMDYAVKISSTNDSSINDISDATFSINAATDAGPQPLIYLPFEGDYSDNSGNGNDPTLERSGINMSLISDGRGQALKFNSQSNNSATVLNGYLSLPSFVVEEMTMMIWVKVLGDIGITGDAAIYSTNYSPNMHRIGVRDDQTVRAADLSTGNYNAGFDASNHQWHHYAVTYDDTSMKLYVNGVLEESFAHSSLPSHISNKEHYIGAHFWGTNGGTGSSRLWAVLDEFKYYGTALTPEQVASEYFTTKGYFSTWSSWLILNSLSGDDALATADPNKDGISNLLSYGLGVDPIDGLGAGEINPLPTADQYDGRGLFQFLVPQNPPSDIRYIVKESFDLDTWNPIAETAFGSAIWQGTGTAPSLGTANPDGRIQISVPSTETINDEPKTFMKLEVELEIPE